MQRTDSGLVMDAPLQMIPASYAWMHWWFPHPPNWQFLRFDSSPLHLRESIHIGPLPGPKCAFIKGSAFPPQPSSLHSTKPSAISQLLWHTVPHRPSWSTCTVPWQGLFIFTNFTSRKKSEEFLICLCVYINNSCVKMHDMSIWPW